MSAVRDLLSSLREKPAAWAVPVALVVLTATLLLERAAIDSLGIRTALSGYHIYYVLFFYNEPDAWWVLLGSLCACGAALKLGDSAGSLQRLLAAPRVRLCLIAACVLLTVTVGSFLTVFAQHNHPFSADEFALTYQSEIFASGHLSAHVPPELQEFGKAMTPTFVSWSAKTSDWHASYLPVYSALRAAFVVMSCPVLLNPLLGGVSVLLIASIARQLWPQNALSPLVAAVLLATSCQLQLTSSSFYSMSAHLAANLLWLWLYLRNTKLSLALAGIIGAFAVGLHQINVHPLFVAPFLLRTVRDRRWGLASYFALVYGAASLFWLNWYEFSHQTAAATSTAAASPAGPALVQTAANTFFGWPEWFQWLNQPMNAVLVYSWQSSAFFLCSILGFAQFRRYDAIAADLVLGLAVTILLYFFYFGNQGHGWGYRYLYSHLGNLVLLSMYGWQFFQERLGESRALRMLAVSTGMFALLQLPLRAVQAEEVVRPFAETQAFFSAQKERVLIVDTGSMWYGEDIIRNDPFLKNGPLVMKRQSLTRKAYNAVPRLGPVREITGNDLLPLGMIPLIPPARTQ